MISELRTLAGELGRCPTLLEYVSETGYDLSDIYKPSIGGWRALLSETEFGTIASTAADPLMSRRFHLVLHIDSVRRLNLYRLLTVSPPTLETLDSLERLTFRPLPAEDRKGNYDWDAGLKRLKQDASAASELHELCDVLFDRVKLHTSEKPALNDCPLFLHRQYPRDEVPVALAAPGWRPPHPDGPCLA